MTMASGGNLSLFASKAETLEAFESYKDETKSSWRCYRSSSTFGKPLKDVLDAWTASIRVRWHLVSDRGMHVPFDGVPFICVDSLAFQCHQGDDIDKKTKERRKKAKEKSQDHDHDFHRGRKLLQETKKLGCPAKLAMSRIIKFPEYQVESTSGRPPPRRKMNLKVLQLRKALENKEHVTAVDVYMMKVPDPSCHLYHPSEDEIAGIREQIEPAVLNRIKELDDIGVRSVAEVKRHLTSFLKTERFRGQQLPLESRRRYFPKDRDIRNALNAAREGKRKAADDQDTVKKLCQDILEENPNDFVFFRASCPTEPTVEKLLFIYQAEWMRRLLVLYGQEMCLMDATYRTCRYAVPLFFLCVRTNVCYIVVAAFIVEHEDRKSIGEALAMIQSQCLDWNPKNMMVDFSLAEINAIEDCFPGSYIHICDFHREKAWQEWTSKSKHGVSHIKEEVLGNLRSIANSISEKHLEQNIVRFQHSTAWKGSPQLRKYFSSFWGVHLQKWVRCYRDESLRIAIYTNNGVERQNRWLKHSYLERRRNSSLSGLVTVLTRQFLPESYRRYRELNLKYSSHYRKYSEDVPSFLQNRPREIVKSILSRIYSANEVTNIKPGEGNTYLVKGANKTYYVGLGSEEHFPTCHCPDQRRNKLLCKHICAVLQLPDCGWGKLGKAFVNHPLFTLDAVVLAGDSVQDTEGMSTPSLARGMERTVDPSRLPRSEEELDKRRKARRKQRCISHVKMLMDEVYNAHDSVLDSADHDIMKIVDRLRSQQKKEQGLAVNGQSVSPVKVARIKRKMENSSLRHVRASKKSRLQSRYGLAAELRRANITVSESSST